MCRRSDVRAILAAIATLVVAAVACASPLQDELADYLERVRATRLLVEHLERELTTSSGDVRKRIVDRLTDAYPQLLEQAEDSAEREDLVRRASALLEKEGPSRGDTLRLALLRARYRTASRVAEDYRVALADDSAVGEAAATLSQVVTQSTELRTRLEARVKELERRSDRTGGLEGDRIVERTDQVRGTIQDALGIEAWANYYRSLLANDRSLAESSQALFARIIDAGDSFPTPKEVSVDLRANEFYANAILGMALAKARTESIGTALEWLNLLDLDRVPDSIRRQLPAWRIAIAVDRSEWATARDLIRTLAADTNTPPAWIRIAAVGGLRAPDGDIAARGLAREAITMLASRHELAQIADLARRFGDAAIGDSGFAGRYVRGITAYERARKAKDAKNAAEAVVAYGEASEHFEAALKASDAAQFASAIGSCRMLAGWSRFERGEFEAALGFFTAAATADARDEESEWMALVSLEKLLAQTPAGEKSEALKTDLRSRIDGFLGRHPSSQRVRDLLVRRMALADVPRREDLETLLSTDDATTGAVEAKRQAIFGLYRLFRETRGAERAAAGKRYLDAMRTLPALTAKPLDGLPGGDALVARQALEIALSSDVSQPDIAEPILNALETHAAAGLLDVAAVGPELRVRRVQLAIAREQLSAAVERLTELEAMLAATKDASVRDSVQRSLDLARRHVFRYASTKLRDASVSGTDRAALAGAAVRTGDAMLVGYEASAGSLKAALDDAQNRLVAVAVLDAIAEALTGASAGLANETLAARGLALGAELRSRDPKDPATLEALGLIAASGPDLELAAECFRELVAGSSVGTDRWFRAKVALIRVLAKTDPARARAVLEQHVKLQPDYGPPPHGDQLRELERQLGQNAANGGAP
ncbi:MAG: hypothetical protein JNM94_10320 [Phycisphaerae bacterium]|nr:hypothetical protein [Phycisphaerae bacterium]